MLIMHINLFSSSNENCGCYGNGNSQNVVKTYGSRDNSKTIWATIMKLGMWTGGNVRIMHIIFILSSNENCGCYGNGYSQNVAKTYGSRDNSKTI